MYFKFLLFVSVLMQVQYSTEIVLSFKLFFKTFTREHREHARV